MSGASLKALAVWLAALACLPLGSVANAGIIEWVAVGDPGNTADTDPAGYGAVATSFRIMKHEFKNQLYTEFLNSVDARGTDPYSVYNASMGTDPRGGISFSSGATSGSKYAVKQDMGDKPVTYVSWFDAARVSYGTQSDSDPTAVTAGSTGIGSAGSAGTFANDGNGADWNSQDGNAQRPLTRRWRLGDDRAAASACHARGLIELAF